jgi:hypothetical protein
MNRMYRQAVLLLAIVLGVVVATVSSASARTSKVTVPSALMHIQEPGSTSDFDTYDFQEPGSVSDFDTYNFQEPTGVYDLL